MAETKGMTVSNKTETAKSEARAKATKGARKARAIVAAKPGPDLPGPDLDAAAKVRALATQHPVALIAGGIVAGVLIGAILPRARNTRLSRGAAALGAMAGEAALAYARKAIEGMSEAAHTVSDEGSRLASGIGERAGGLIDTVQDEAGTYSAKAADGVAEAAHALRGSAEGLARHVIRLTSQLRH